MKNQKMNEFKIGDLVKLSDKTMQFYQEHSDDLFGYPEFVQTETFIKKNKLVKFYNSLGGIPSVSEQLNEYFLYRYSLDRDLDLEGIIVGDNGEYGINKTYIVWLVNELGEDISYFCPEELEKL